MESIDGDGMPWVDLDQFVIRKGDGVFNIYDFINAMLGSDNVADGFANLQESHHDLDHDAFTGVEADAVKIAIERGLVDSSIANIVNEGPDPQKPQRWQFAFIKAMEAGAPIINDAIRRTNVINQQRSDASGHQFIPIPDAFVSDPQQRRKFKVADAWTASVVGYAQDGNTHDKFGQLITQYRSKNTQKPESYARPYWQGLQQERHERHPEVKAPTPSKEIRPGILHTDTLYFKDSNLKFPLGQAVIDLKNENPGVPMDQLQMMALEKLKQMPRFRKFAGLRHTGGIEYGKYSDTGLQDMAAQQVAEVSDMASDPSIGFDQFLHPELRESPAFSGKYDSNRVYHGNKSNPMPTDRKTIAGLKQHHGWDDETVASVFADAHSGNYKGNSRNRILQAIHAQEMRDGKPPTWVDPNAQIPPGGAIPSPVAPPATPQPDLNTEGRMRPPQPGVGGQPVASTQPVVSTEDATPAPPPPPINPAPPPPPANVHMNAAGIPPQNPRPNPIPIPNAYAPQPSASRMSGETNRMGRLLNTLGYHFESMFPNFSKSDDDDDETVLKNMLEDVQMRIAKEEISTPKLSIHSMTDVNAVANQMNRPPSDIITIVHSRGDWNSLAKSFSLRHDEIQTVKVMFDE